jgi:hypothetical protein
MPANNGRASPSHDVVAGMAINSTFSRAEVAHILDLSPATVDALIDGGQLLCRMQHGEARVPLEVLERFLRDSMIRLYQAEAMLRLPAAAPAPVEAAMPEPERYADEPEPEREFEPEPEPEPEVARPTMPPFLPITMRDEEEEEPGSDRPDLRAARRYVPRRQIDGILGDTKFTIVQISKTGLRIRHRGSLMPGDEMKLSFALLAPARSVVLRARVVWTSLAKGASETFSISGLKIIEHADRLERAIDSLLASHDLEPERRVRERRSTSPITLMPDGVSDEEIAAVLGALQRFASDPVEANRWYSRARFALADEKVRREAPQRPRDREEVLGLWEFLERQIEIPKIAGVVTWMRKAKAV